MTEVVPYVCDEAEARALTDKIKGSVEQTWRLLLNAHEWKAWAALGYGSWRDYAMTEFGLSQSRAYQLLDAAKVTLAIEAAADSTSVELTEAVARDLKPHLDEVTDAVRDAVADVPEADRPAAAAAAVKEARERHRPQPSPPPVDSTPPAPERSPGGSGEPTTREAFIAQRDTGEVVSPEQWQAQDDARLEGERQQMLADTDNTFLANLAKRVAANNLLLALPPERVAALCSDPAHDDDLASLNGFLTDMTTWIAAVRAALDKPAATVHSLRRAK